MPAALRRVLQGQQGGRHATLYNIHGTLAWCLQGGRHGWRLQEDTYFLPEISSPEPAP